VKWCIVPGTLWVSGISEGRETAEVRSRKERNNLEGGERGRGVGVTYVVSRHGVHHEQLGTVENGRGPAAAFGGFIGVVASGDAAGLMLLVSGSSCRWNESSRVEEGAYTEKTF
jgi:hypothetical protein